MLRYQHESRSAHVAMAALASLAFVLALLITFSPSASAATSIAGTTTDPVALNAVASLPLMQQRHIVNDPIRHNDDICSNILGDESFVPDGFIQNDVGQCGFRDRDVCDNVGGFQDFVPSEFIPSDNGFCFPRQQLRDDRCRNLVGIQTLVPIGLDDRFGGACVRHTQVIVVNDICPNIRGSQFFEPQGDILLNGRCIDPFNTCNRFDGFSDESLLPDGFGFDPRGQCVFQGQDFCGDMLGFQTFVPTGFITVGNDSCVRSSFNGDFCPNFGGDQSFLPDGFLVNDRGRCFRNDVFGVQRHERNVRVIRHEEHSSNDVVITGNHHDGF